MYHSQMVYLVIAGFFLNHNIEDGFPPVIGKLVSDSVVDKSDMDGDDLLPAAVKCCTIFSLRVEAVGVDQCLIVA
jgi:hypothetical protein